MKIYNRPTFEFVEIKYELVADGGNEYGGLISATNKGNMGVIDDTGSGSMDGGLGDEGDFGEAAAYRGLWDDSAPGF